jgi:hypothetical protein
MARYGDQHGTGGHPQAIAWGAVGTQGLIAAWDFTSGDRQFRNLRQYTGDPTITGDIGVSIRGLRLTGNMGLDLGTNPNLSFNGQRAWSIVLRLASHTTGACPIFYKADGNTVGDGWWMSLTSGTNSVQVVHEHTSVNQSTIAALPFGADTSGVPFVVCYTVEAGTPVMGAMTHFYYNGGELEYGTRSDGSGTRGNDLIWPLKIGLGGGGSVSNASQDVTLMQALFYNRALGAGEAAIVSRSIRQLTLAPTARDWTIAALSVPPVSSGRVQSGVF